MRVALVRGHALEWPKRRIHESKALFRDFCKPRGIVVCCGVHSTVALAKSKVRVKIIFGAVADRASMAIRN